MASCFFDEVEDCEDASVSESIKQDGSTAGNEKYLIVRFGYLPSQSGENAARYLEGFRGYL